MVCTMWLIKLCCAQFPIVNKRPLKSTVMITCFFFFLLIAALLDLHVVIQLPLTTNVRLAGMGIARYL